MTQTISTTSENVNPARSGFTTGLTSDAQTLPPFAALDELDAQVAAMDSWCSNFIGRMQPYCAPTAPHVGPLADSADDNQPESTLSGLENRIYGLCTRIGMIRGAMDTMNEGLRL